jgi:aerobic carbon-monoxide dehydrogenase medium subunit
MKPAPFAYTKPSTLDEVVELLGEHGDEAKILAGGQSLVPMLAMRLARPTVVVDVNDIPGLSDIEDRDDVLAFGATTRERDAERSALVSGRIPLMADALPLIGHVAIRNRGTIGGSIAHADASAELPAVATVTDAEMVLRSHRGERIIGASEFFVGHYATALEDDECLVEIRVPTTPLGSGWAFQEVARRHGDFALVGVGAMVALDDDRTIQSARLCLIGVADRPVRMPEVEAALAGERASDDIFAAAAADATKDLRPPSDMHGSSDFRRHLAAVTTRRALSVAAQRSEGRR